VSVVCYHVEVSAWG